MSELASMFVGADQWAWYHVEIIMQRDGAMFGVAGRVFCPGRQEAHLVAAWLVITAHPQANRIACAGCDLFISPSQASTMAASAPTSPPVVS